MSRVARSAAPAAEPPYPVWKAKAVKALQRLHERAAIVTRDRIWTRAYILRLDPAQAAEWLRESGRRAGDDGRPEGAPGQVRFGNPRRQDTPDRVWPNTGPGSPTARSAASGNLCLPRLHPLLRVDTRRPVYLELADVCRPTVRSLRAKAEWLSYSTISL